MKNERIIDLRDGRFTVEDFDSEHMIAEIVIDGSKEINFVNFNSIEIMECAVQNTDARQHYISGWDEPHFPGGSYMVHEPHPQTGEDVAVSFSGWWVSLSIHDKEVLIKEAVMRFADAGLRKLETELVPSETAINRMKENRIAA